MFEIAIEIEIEDGVIWVYDSSEDGKMAFTDFGIENLIDLIKIHKDDPTIPAEAIPLNPAACACVLRRMDTFKLTGRKNARKMSAHVARLSMTP